MSEKRFNSRVIHKHDIEENWSKASFIPNKGEIIVYDIDDNFSYERIKVGDGVQNVNELPFVTDALETAINGQITLVSQALLNVSSLVGDTAVSTQISNAISENAVQFVEQSLTDEQKQQAQENIGIKIATEDEIIEMMAEIDMLPVVTDSDGAILADESNNIILW